MQSMPTLSDRELLARMPTLVRAERAASAEVIAHLMEIDRRRLYLGEACSSLYAYCRERLGYSEDAALKRARVARLALRLPRALDELRAGAEVSPHKMERFRSLRRGDRNARMNLILFWLLHQRRERPCA